MPWPDIHYIKPTNEWLRPEQRESYPGTSLFVPTPSPMPPLSPMPGRNCTHVNECEFTLLAWEDNLIILAAWGAPPTKEVL